MATEDTKAVVDETKDQAKPDAAGTDARKADDLDALLNEFDSTATKPAEAKPDTKADTTAKGDDPVAQRLAALEEREADRQFQSDIKPAIDRVRGNVPTEVYDDDDVRDWMDREARKDPRLQQAWRDRHKDPAKFGKVLDGLSRKLAQKFAKAPDKNATEDREAVTAAVRGASTKAPEGKAPKFGELSNSEFSKSVKENYGFDPGF